MDVRDNKTGSVLTELKNACSKTGYGVVYLPYIFNDGTEIDSLFRMISDSSAIHNAIGDSPGILPADMSELEAIGDSDGLQFNPLSKDGGCPPTDPHRHYIPAVRRCHRRRLHSPGQTRWVCQMHASPDSTALAAFRKCKHAYRTRNGGEAEASWER